MKQPFYGGTTLDFQSVQKLTPSNYCKNTRENLSEVPNDDIRRLPSLKLFENKLTPPHISHSEKSKKSLPQKTFSIDSFTSSKQISSRSYCTSLHENNRPNSAELKNRSLYQKTSNIDSFTSKHVSSRNSSTCSRESSRPNNMPLKNGRFKGYSSKYLENSSHMSDFIDDPNEPFEPGPGDIDYYKHPALNGDRAISCVARIAKIPHQTAESAAKTYGEIIQRGGMTLLGTYHTLMSLQNTRASFHTEQYNWSSLPKKAIIPVSIQGEMRPVVYMKENGNAYIYESNNMVPVDNQRHKLLPHLGYIEIAPGILPKLPNENTVTVRR